ncbi:MAG: hypothetical protein HQL35_14335 [Alphaproteobacteria bacterium]|nr:hypothetical protein [Alphaproteobacteria bacterium]
MPDVKLTVTAEIGGAWYGPGWVLRDLSVDEADVLVSRGVAVARDAGSNQETLPNLAAGLAQAISAALADGRLDPKNPDQFTTSGAPEVKALAALAGFRPSAKERDAAWALVRVAD